MEKEKNEKTKTQEKTKQKVISIYFTYPVIFKFRFYPLHYHLFRQIITKINNQPFIIILNTYHFTLHYVPHQNLQFPSIIPSKGKLKGNSDPRSKCPIEHEIRINFIWVRFVKKFEITVTLKFYYGLSFRKV